MTAGRQSPRRISLGTGFEFQHLDSKGTTRAVGREFVRLERGAMLIWGHLHRLREKMS
jgi:hypothetical protein